jgi:hypothetical protein
MSYKPKYCCQCGEKVERANWRIWTNRRFCELCETDFGLYDWIPTLVLAVGLILGVVGIGNLGRKQERDLIVLSNQSPGNLQNSNKGFIAQSSEATNSNQIIAQPSVATKANNSSVQIKSPVAPVAFKTNEKSKSFENQPDTTREIVYFCGAQTKKGTPCSRHIKNAGGRCWQHVGQTAILPPEKLIANQ